MLMNGPQPQIPKSNITGLYSLWGKSKKYNQPSPIVLPGRKYLGPVEITAHIISPYY